jgi:hypothetical protein
MPSHESDIFIGRVEEVFHILKNGAEEWPVAPAQIFFGSDVVDQALKLLPPWTRLGFCEQIQRLPSFLDLAEDFDGFQ